MAHWISPDFPDPPYHPNVAFGPYGSGPDSGRVGREPRLNKPPRGRNDTALIWFAVEVVAYLVWRLNVDPVTYRAVTTSVDIHTRLTGFSMPAFWLTGICWLIIAIATIIVTLKAAGGSVLTWAIVAFLWYQFGMDALTSTLLGLMHVHNTHPALTALLGVLLWVAIALCITAIISLFVRRPHRSTGFNVWRRIAAVIVAVAMVPTTVELVMVFWRIVIG